MWWKVNAVAGLHSYSANSAACTACHPYTSSSEHREEISQSAAEGLIYQLEEAHFLSKREANLMKAALSRDTLLLKLPYRDQLRARLLKAMLISLLATK